MLSSVTGNGFDPYDLFPLACWLYDTAAPPPSPALLRTIINRAYFAALICAREKTGSSTRGQNGHVAVVDALRGMGGYGYTANKLNALRAARREADYELSRNISVNSARISIGDAREVLYALGYSPPPARPYCIDYLDSNRFLNAQ